MTHTNLRQKFGLMLVSLMAAGVIIEAALRIAGFVQVSIQTHRNRLTLSTRGSYRILCVGESTTFLGGENSYPSQLERILNELRPDKKFSVINKGLPGIGSCHIIDHLDAWLTAYQPDMVVVMMGINDHNAMRPWQPKTAAARLRSLFEDLRIYKLIKWLNASRRNTFSQKHHPAPGTKHSAAASPKSGQDNDSFENFKDGMDVILQELNRLPNAYRQLYNYALICIQKKDYAFAVQIFERLNNEVQDDQLKLWFTRKTADCYLAQGNFPELAKVITRLLKTNSYDAWITTRLWDACRAEPGTRHIQDALIAMLPQKDDQIPLYEHLGTCHAAAGEEKLAEDYYQKVRQLRARYFNPVTKMNYLKLCDALAERNIKGVFVQYPLRQADTLKKMLGEKSRSPDFIIVDNEKIFREALNRGRYEEYFTDRFGGDFGHCTPRGNDLLAQNIASAILKKFFGE
ncbi:MAG: GDSL-type esterase/lipase family protein [Candidatus Omnitrophota bacterium]